MSEHSLSISASTRHPRTLPVRGHSGERDIEGANELSPDVLARFLHALADPTRLRILEYLARHGETNVSTLVEYLQQPQGRVSSHLSCLRTCGLVRVRREGKYRFYELADHRIPILLAFARDLARPHAQAIAMCRYALQH